MTKLYVINGPEIGQSFDIREGVMFLGRSLDNDIWINERTVSRKHLKIVRKGERYFVSDLASRNGSFYQGEYLQPGREVELQAGEALAIGKVVLCLGEGCRGQMAPFLDTTSVMRRSAKEELESEDRRKRTVQKRHDLLSQVSVALKDNKPLEEILRSVLVHVFSYLKRIDRGAFVLVEPGTLVVEKTICLSAKRRGEATHPYSEKVARKVLSTGKPLVFSKVCTENEEGLVDTLKLQKIESVLCVPLMNGSQVLGIMYIDSMKRPDGFRKDDLLDLLDIGQRVALSVQKERISLDVLKIATTLSEESQE